MQYGIPQARVPNVVGDISAGLGMAKQLGYMDDKPEVDTTQFGRQAVEDFSKIAKNVDRSNPNEVKQALAWAATRNPHLKDVVWKALQGTPEEQSDFIDMFQAEGAGPETERMTLYGPGGETKRISLNKGEDYTPPAGWTLSAPKGEGSKFVRGKPFVNEENERVVPIYDKTTQELVRTETLGKAKQKEELPPIVWTDEQLDFMADKLIATGEKPMKTRGPEANYLNQVVEQLAAKKQMSKGVGGAETTFLQKDRKAIQTSITAQEKQRGSMVSFVANLSAQVDHVKDIAEEINTFDTRFLNKPLIWVKKKLKGDPQLSKYEVYLGEIQSEIGKLSSGSTASVSELSQGAREKWESILDENLSINDMIQVLEEVKEAGNIRMESVDAGLRASRAGLRQVGFGKKNKKNVKKKKLKYNMETGGFE